MNHSGYSGLWGLTIELQWRAVMEVCGLIWVKLLFTDMCDATVTGTVSLAFLWST